MSAVTRPRGPLPARVYWVRRVVLLGAVFLLVFTMGKVLGGGGDGDDGKDAAQAVAGEQSSDAVPEETGTPPVNEPRKKKAKKPKPKKTKEPLPEPTGDCDPADIRIGALVSRVANDGRVRIPLEVKGNEEACTFDVSASSVVIKITSGSDQIWSSQECSAKVDAGEVVVREEKPAKVVLLWNGRRSDDECSQGTKWALPGGYHVVSAALGGEPTDRYFELTTPPRKKVYKETKPKKSKQDKAKKKRDRDRPSDGASTPVEEPRDTRRDGAQEPNG